MTRHSIDRMILLVVLIVGVDDACGGSTGLKAFQNVSGNWNYASDTIADSVAQLSCSVTTPMTLAQQTDGTVMGTYAGMSVSCQSPSGAVILHRNGKVSGHTLIACGFFTPCPPPAGSPPYAAEIDFDTTAMGSAAFRNLALVSDGTHLSGSVTVSIPINGKLFGGTGGWTATKR